MKNFHYREFQLERQLQRAMLQQAKGVPAESVLRLRLLFVWSVVRRIVGRLFLFVVLLSFLGAHFGTGLLGDGISVTILSLLLTGGIVVFLGQRMLLPENGVALVYTPVSSKQLIIPIFWRLAGYLIILCLCAFGVFLFKFEGDGHEALIATVGWMMVPLMGVSWQFLHKGKAGPFLFWVGVALGGGWFCCWILRPVKAVSGLHEKILAYEAWMPLHWLKYGGGVWVALVLFLVFTVLLFRIWNHYCFRAMPGAQVAQSFVVQEPNEIEMLDKPEESPSDSIEPILNPHAEREEKVRCLSMTTGLFWDKGEKQIGRQLGLGTCYWVGLKSLLILLVLLLVQGLLIYGKEWEQDVRGSLVFCTMPVIILFLIRGWKSEVIQMAFSKFRLPNELFQSIAASLPVEEKRLFGMFLKESIAVFLFILPLQILSLKMILNQLEQSLSVSQWVVIVVLLTTFYFTLKAGAWARYLGESMSFFQPGFRGETIEALLRFIFLIVAVALFLAGLSFFSAWFLTGESLPLALLFFFFNTAWVGGFCWLIRARYLSGKGSAVVRIKKKKKSFRLS